MTNERRSRQCAEVLAVARHGDLDRALALALDHLIEFPADADILAAISDRLAACDDAGLCAEGRDLLRSKSR